jgi:hypothetical protein
MLRTPPSRRPPRGELLGQRGDTRRGVKFVKPSEKAERGTFAIFKDSEGNQFVLSSR